MLNPFAMYLYLQPVMQELDTKTFFKVLAKATIISFLIFSIFIFGCNLLIDRIFQINIESFRVFGGIIIFSYAYYFIIKGEKAYVFMKGNLDDLASEIALPFMVGAGTITLSLFLGYNGHDFLGAIIVLVTLIVNLIMILILKFFKEYINKKRYKIAFDKNMEILLRLNGFFIGAIGINMIRIGIENLYL